MGQETQGHFYIFVLLLLYLSSEYCVAGILSYRECIYANFQANSKLRIYHQDMPDLFLRQSK